MIAYRPCLRHKIHNVSQGTMPGIDPLVDDPNREIARGSQRADWIGCLQPSFVGCELTIFPVIIESILHPMHDRI